jgi:MFS family permease
VLFTVAEMMSFPISTTWVGDHSPPGQRATYMGFYVMSFSASFVIGTMLGPAVWEWKGTEVLSYGMIAMGIFAILFFQKMQRAKIHDS